MTMGFISCLKLVLYLTALGIYEFRESHAIRIGAFNIQVFGKSKASKPEVMDILTKIISRYDLLLIQEIRDSTGTAIEKLLAQVNDANQQNPFTMEISERLGRTTSKEQYAFFYRKGSGLSVANTYTFDDGDERLNTNTTTVDLFEREPYIVTFTSENTRLAKFTLAGIHIAPDEAVKELNHLWDVFRNVETRLGIKDIMVLGDLNADCSYVPQKSWPDVILKNDPMYTWLISDEDDTTVSGTNCAYDRFIYTGNGFSNGIIAGSVAVFKFDEQFSLSDELAKDVSDHYPIEFELDQFTSSSTRLCVTSIALITSAFIAIIFLYL